MGREIETRSFKPRVKNAVGEITPIDPSGLTTEQKLDAVLLQGNQLHSCMEMHIAATRLAELESSERRRKTDAKLDLVTEAVGALDARQDMTEGAVAALAHALGAQVATGKVKVRAGIGWKDAWKIAGAVGGCTGLFIFLFQSFVKLWPHFVAYMMSLSPT